MEDDKEAEGCVRTGEKGQRLREAGLEGTEEEGKKEGTKERKGEGEMRNRGSEEATGVMRGFLGHVGEGR